MLGLSAKRKYSLPCFSFLSFTFLIFQPSHATETLVDTFFTDQVPVVLSATRLAQPQTEAPASITVIDREMIRLSGAKQVAEVFRLVPGMHVNYFRGNRAVVGYQGLNSDFPRGVQVLIDGRAIYSPVFGGVDWANLPISIEDIERIEVIRGPNSASFGANAFQSVINIMTSHSSQSGGVQFKTTVGERGYQRHFVRAGNSYSRADFHISASHTDNNGYENNFDDSRQDKLNTRIDYQLTRNDSLQINASAINTLREISNPNDPSDPTDPHRNLDESYFSLHGKWEHQKSPEQLFITQLSYTRFKSKDRFTSTFDGDFPPIGAVSGITTFIDTTKLYSRWNFEFEHQLKASENTRITWGLGLRADETEIPFWTNTTSRHKNSMQRVFSNVEWRPLNHLLINFAALWEHSQLSGDAFSPRMAVNYLLTPKQSVRFIASHSFRTPAVVENKLDTDLNFQVGGHELVMPILRGASNLDAETVRSFEIGYHHLLLRNALTVDLKLFTNQYDHLIDTNRMTLAGATTFDGASVGPAEIRYLDNLEHVNTSGYEIEINYKPNKNNLLHIGYTHNHSNGSEDMVKSIPKDSFNILASHTFDNHYWSSLAYYYTGSMENLNSGNPLGPMRRLDFNLGKPIQVTSSQSIDISFTAQLALDRNKDFLDGFFLDNRAFIEASYTFH